MKKKVVIVDGHNLLFRMFFGIPSSIRNSKGREIKGLVGFVGSLKKLVMEFNPYALIVIFDSESSRDNNLKIDDSYKQGRVDYADVIEDENPFSQLPLIQRALDFLNIFNLEVTQNEADDFIASLTSNNDYQYIIVSTDSDFIQLVNDNIHLYVPRGKSSILYNEERVAIKYNISPNQYVLYKSLVGDKSDNISGIKGIGPVIASKILKYDFIDNYILENNDSKLSNLLIENKEKISRNIELITLNRDIDTSMVKFDKLSSKVMDLKTYEIIDGIGER